MRAALGTAMLAAARATMVINYLDQVPGGFAEIMVTSNLAHPFKVSFCESITCETGRAFHLVDIYNNTAQSFLLPSNVINIEGFLIASTADVQYNGMDAVAGYYGPFTVHASPSILTALPASIAYGQQYSFTFTGDAAAVYSMDLYQGASLGIEFTVAQSTPLGPNNQANITFTVPYTIPAGQYTIGRSGYGSTNLAPGRPVTSVLDGLSITTNQTKVLRISNVATVASLRYTIKNASYSQDTLVNETTDALGNIDVPFTMPPNLAYGSYSVAVTALYGDTPAAAFSDPEISYTAFKGASYRGPATGSLVTRALPVITISTPPPYTVNSTLAFDVAGLASGQAFTFALYSNVSSVAVPNTTGGGSASPQGTATTSLMIPPGLAAGGYKVRVTANTDIESDTFNVGLQPVWATITSIGPYRAGVSTIDVKASGFTNNELFFCIPVFASNLQAASGSVGFAYANSDGTAVIRYPIPADYVGANYFFAVTVPPGIRGYIIQTVITIEGSSIITTAKSTIKTGDQVRFNITRAGSSANITYRLYNTSTNIYVSPSPVTANSAGAATISFPMPLNAVAGAYNLAAISTTSSGTAYSNLLSFNYELAALILALTSSGPFKPGGSVNFVVSLAVSTAPITYTLYLASDNSPATTPLTSDATEAGTLTTSLTLNDVYSGVYYLRATAPNQISNQVALQVQATVVITTDAPYYANQTIAINVAGVTPFGTISYALYHVEHSGLPAKRSLKRRGNVIVPNTTGSKAADEFGEVQDDVNIPAGLSTGTYFVRVTAAGADSDSNTFVLDVTNPVVTITSTGPYKPEQSVAFTISGVPNGDEITYALYDPLGAQLAGASGSGPAGDDGTLSTSLTIPVATYTPDGDYTVRAIANGLGSNAAVFRIQTLVPSGGGERRRRLRRRKLKADCPVEGETACHFKSGNFECVDLKTDLMHCGGCNMEGMPQQGENCLEIPYAVGVACVRGSCRVSSCEGFKYPLMDKSGCSGR